MSEFFTTLRSELGNVQGKKARMKVIGRVLSHFHVESKLAAGKTFAKDPYDGVKKALKRGICISCYRNPIDWTRSSRKCTKCLDEALEKKQAVI